MFSATMLYVDPSSPAADDSGTGTIDAPFQSLAGAQKFVRSINQNMADDIIVKPNVAASGTSLPDAMLKPNGDYVMGLIAENYVRVYHRTNTSDCSKNVEAMTTATIHAAILSLQHSFIVDNYGCGQPLGDLNVKGAIAQRYRGPVGTGNATTNSTGYLKNYEYDDRLRYRTPPFFLDPVKVTWKVLKTNEQVPPAK